MSEKMLQDMNIDLHDSPGVLPNEKDFVEGTGDSYAIYQLKAIPENHTLLFARLSELDQPVRKDSYEMVYTGPLPHESSDNDLMILENLFIRFNLQHPEDFRGHSLSVSDVVVLRRENEIRSYYTDSFGFEQLPDFYPKDNPLRNAEIGLEDDYNMIDGIINNGPKQEKEQLPVPELKPDEPQHRHHKHRPAPER